jgi:hypothetical protein
VQKKKERSRKVDPTQGGKQATETAYERAQMSEMANKDCKTLLQYMKLSQ